MAFALFSPSRAAGVLLALILAACGGGGGGGTTPPVNPPATDTDPPKVMSVTPANGATGVIPTTKVEATYDEALKCDGVTGQTVQIAGVDATVACDSVAKKMSLTPKSALPADTMVTATLPAATDMSGNKGLPVSVTFKTAAPVAVNPKFYVGNLPAVDGSNAVTVVDMTTGSMKAINFPAVPSVIAIINAAVDTTALEAYFAGSSGYQLYVVDVATDTLKSLIKFDPTPGASHQVFGMQLVGTDICLAMSGSTPVGFSQNRLRCWSRSSHLPTFEGANNSLAAEPMFTTGLKYAAAPANKLYAVSALRSTIVGGNPVYPAGTPGVLTVVNPSGYAVEQTFSVGSVPVALDVHPTTGDVYVANAGDKNVSIVNPATGRTEVMGLGFTRTQQRPESLVLAPAKDQVFVSDGESKVYVYSLTTRREVAQFSVGVGTSIPKRLAILGNELWVTCSSGMIVVVNLDTLSVSRTVSVGLTPVAFASYAPGSAQ
ncbi:MAG: Ig-like domain-containing protein [Undibacterium sp.]